MPGKPSYEELVQKINKLETAEAECKREKAALRGQLLHQKNLMDASLDGIAIIDQKHRIRQANKSFAQMLGYTMKEVLELHTWDWESIMSEEEIRANFADLTKTRTTFETRHRRKDGTLYDAEVTACGAKLGDEPMIMTITRDITSRLQDEEALRDSEEKYRVLFNQSLMGIFLHDLEGRIVDVNEISCIQSGYSKSELLGLSVFDLHPDIPSTVNLPKSEIQKLWRQWQPGDRHTYEAEHQRKDGTVFPIEISTGPLKYRGVNHIIAISQDITERRQAEEDLRESELKFRSITEQSSDLISLTDENGTIIYASPSSKNLFDCQPDEMVGRPFTEFLVESSVSVAMSAFLETIQSGHAVTSIELLMKRKDGSHFYGELSGSLFNSKHTLGTLVVIRDITDRKQAEESLRESEKRFRDLADLLPEVVFEADANADLIYANKQAFSLFGYKEDDLIKGLNALEMIAHEDKKRAKDNIALRLKGKKLGASEYKAERKDGMIFPVLLHANPIIHHGIVQGIRGIIIDITERKNVESKIRQAQKMESIGNLSGGIAHDFNNILFPIVGMSELLMEDFSEGSPFHESAKHIFKAAMRGSDLVKQILAFSRQSEHKKIPVRVQKIVEEALKLMRATIPSFVEIEEDIQPNCGLIMADPTQIHQVTMNVMTNAFHAVKSEGGKITIRLSAIDRKDADFFVEEPVERQYALLSISDTGPGISSNLMSKIFEPYFTTKEKGEGTGLGLAVAYGIVKEHRGEITVYSEEGKGATFHIYLPLLAKRNGNDKSEKTKADPGGSEHILLVDDEEAIARLEKQILERLGYKVTMRVNSEEALEAFRTNPNSFHLVLSDMTMPNMTGDQLAEKMIAIRPNIPVIICTGFSERINQKNATAIGAKGFLMKPIVKSEMAKMVRKVLDEARASTQG